jgi:hypothetical protein
MSDYNNQVDFSISDGFLEPLFLDCLFHRLYNGIIRIPRKVKQEAECQHSQLLVFGLKLPHALRKWLSLPCFGIEDVQIRGQIVFSEIRYRLV